ncbi:MAG: hypothetical protein WBB52_02540 [Acidimicrobiales bacterium]|jgi:hypothetical protein
MESMSELETTQAGIEALVSMAVDAATTLEEVLDCARAAAALGDRGLMERVASRVGHEVAKATASSDAWEAELTYSKIDAWVQTGHKARILAEAWRLVGQPLLLDTEVNAVRVANPLAGMAPDPAGSG